MIAKLAICATVLLGVGQEGEQPSKGVDLLQVELNVIQYTNAERAKYGLAALEIDPALMQSARQHTAWMVQSHSLVHSGRPVAENIAMGQRHSSEAVRSWMNSSGHRANMLNRGHRRIGVAAYYTPSGTIFWCQQFQQ